MGLRIPWSNSLVYRLAQCKSLDRITAWYLKNPNAHKPDLVSVCAGFTSCKSYGFFCASSLFPLPKALKGAREYIYFGLQCALCEFQKRLPWFMGILSEAFFLSARWYTKALLICVYIHGELHSISGHTLWILATGLCAGFVEKYVKPAWTPA